MLNGFTLRQDEAEPGSLGAMIGAVLGASAQQKSKPATQKKKKNGNGDKNPGQDKKGKTKIPAGATDQSDKENTKKRTSALKQEWLKFAKDYIGRHKVSSGKNVGELMKEAGEECCPHLFLLSCF